MSYEVNRRDFLRFASGGALGTATSGISLYSLSHLSAALASEEVKVPRGPEAWAVSVCTLCPGACGLRVRTIGERAVKIQGNPLHPVNRGGLCPKGLAGLQALYHPDRLREPLKNVGSRKSPKWQAIPWPEAISTLATRLRELPHDALRPRFHSDRRVSATRRHAARRLRLGTDGLLAELRRGPSGRLGRAYCRDACFRALARFGDRAANQIRPDRAALLGDRGAGRRMGGAAAGHRSGAGAGHRLRAHYRGPLRCRLCPRPYVWLRGLD